MADLVVPTLGESITEAVISRWMKNLGDRVEVDEPVLELESDKVTLTLPAPAAGALSEQRYAQGATVKVGEVVGQIAVGAGQVAARPAAAPTPTLVAAAPTPARAAAPAPVAATEGNGEGRRLSPSMRKAQREGRPVDPAVAPAPVRGPAAASQLPATRPAAAAPGERENLVPMSPLRKRIAERLVEAQHSAAALTTFNEVDMSAVMALRERHKQAFADEHGVKLGFMSFFAKAAVAALKLYPGLNAEVRGEAIVYKRFYDLGIAVSTDKGLIVPVLRDVDGLGFAEIEQGIAALALRARENKLTLPELTGGSFTITNGGIYGSMMSTPLLNHPQTGILGMHNIVSRPVAVAGKVELRPMMYLAVTYDHRVVDGREAVSFLIAVKDRIEQPDRMMFEL